MIGLRGYFSFIDWIKLENPCDSRAEESGRERKRALERLARDDDDDDDDEGL